MKRRQPTSKVAIQVGPLKFTGKAEGLVGACGNWKSKAGTVDYFLYPDNRSWESLTPDCQDLGRFEARHEAMLAVLNWWVKRRKKATKTV